MENVVRCEKPETFFASGFTQLTCAEVIRFSAQSIHRNLNRQTLNIESEAALNSLLVSYMRYDTRCNTFDSIVSKNPEPWEKRRHLQQSVTVLSV